MRTAVVVTVLLVLATVATAGQAAGAPPQDRCALSDPRLAETSGLAWSPDGLLVVNDSGNPSTVYRLDGRCAVAGTRAVPEDGRDVEDLARTDDGTLWLADTGDNARTRASVALIRLPPGGREQVTRLTYPDGPHDAETLVMPADRRPVLVTKDPGGRSGIYTTAAAPSGPGPVMLRRVGTATVPPSTTPGGPVPFGSGLYTGGALSADGRVVALRTYTDAWLYPVAVGDHSGGASADAVVAALATVPVTVPLPGEPQGEALAFAPDGTLLSAGESPPGARASVRAVPGATALVDGRAAGAPPGPTVSPSPTATRVPPEARDDGASVSTLLLTGAAAGVVAGTVGAVAAVRIRRRRRGGRGRRP